MRSYANFLLFEDVLTNLPSGSDLIISASNTLMNPYVQVVENDCGTLLGSIIPLDYTALGKTELANNTPLNETRIQTLLNQGVSTIRIRTISTCISKGGVCNTCRTASFDGPSIPVNSYVTLSSEFIYHTDLIVGDGINYSYPVSQTSADYTKTNVSGGAYFPEVQSLTDTTITFDTVRTSSQIFALEYYKVSSDPFLEYIAKSYSGALLGLSPLPSYQLLLKPSLYETMFSDSQMQLLRNELNAYTNNIPPTYLQYCDTIVDTLERVLFIIYLYAIYANVQ